MSLLELLISLDDLDLYTDDANVWGVCDRRLTPAELAALREHKPALVSMLKRKKGPPVTTPIPEWVQKNPAPSVLKNIPNGEQP